MRIAVIGAGISGLASAYMLSREHSVTLFEAQDYFGGHTHTHHLEMYGRHYSVDSGFIVYNPQHYPLLTRLFDEIGVLSQPTTMSFSLRNEASGLQYNATNLDGLFAQRRNLVSPRFIKMVADLLRFYREAPAVVTDACNELTLGEYLLLNRYGRGFAQDHLIPMGAALWSCPPRDVLGFPVRHFVQFMANHQMLQVSGRSPWRVVRGGSASYVAALRSMWNVMERLNQPVRQVRRMSFGVEVRTDWGTEPFDCVVMACHSDQALSLLADPSAQERQILGQIRYQQNQAVLHTDPAVLPSKRKLWAAWNAFIPRDEADGCRVSYCMNILQGIESPQPFIVSLNANQHIRPERILRKMSYAHPVFSRDAVAAQKRKAEIQGKHRTWYAGAYWGWGFHEDGMRSAVEIAQAFATQGARREEQAA